jgi:hypothetical protein
MPMQPLLILGHKESQRPALHHDSTPSDVLCSWDIDAVFQDAHLQEAGGRQVMKVIPQYLWIFKN